MTAVVMKPAREADNNEWHMQHLPCTRLQWQSLHQAIEWLPTAYLGAQSSSQAMTELSLVDLDLQNKHQNAASQWSLQHILMKPADVNFHRSKFTDA